MPYSTNINQLGGKVQISAVGANSGTFNVNTFSSSSDNENTTELVITKVKWSGNVVIQRGANSVLSFVDSGEWDLSGDGMAWSVDSTANIDIQVAATTDTCLLEVKKISTYDPVG